MPFKQIVEKLYHSVLAHEVINEPLVSISWILDEMLKNFLIFFRS